MQSHLSTAIAVMVPEDINMFVPCIVGTTLQAKRPRYHFPPYRHWIRVGGIQMIAVEMPEMLRFKI